jgi:GGDEF domain-containing protein
MLERVGQEANEAELCKVASDFLALFAGNHDEELLRRRIELGRELHAAEVSLEQLVTTYALLLGHCYDELGTALPSAERELQRLKYGGTSLLFDLGLLLLGYEGEVVRQIQMLSEADVLTGLLSRRKFEEELEETLEFARRTKRELSLCWIALDNFKLVNDVYGYTIGDIVLSVDSHFNSEKLLTIN